VPRGQPPRRLRIGVPEPGDEQDGAWPRGRPEQMDARFVERLERAIERGEERRQGEHLNGCPRVIHPRGHLPVRLLFAFG